LIIIGIVCVIGTVIVKLTRIHGPVPAIVWPVVAIVSLLILLRSITGGSLGIS
jgi:hypothetical protein